MYAELVFHIVFYEPRIPGNTGAAIRLAACTGARLHLVEPLGFSFEDSHLKRAGLDYHDLADLRIHADFEALLRALPDSRIFAFTGHTSNSFADVAYRETDAFLFGPEPTGLPAHVIAHPAVTAAVRIPMMPHLRSLNLANSPSTKRGVSAATSDRPTFRKRYRYRKPHTLPSVQTPLGNIIH